MLHLIEKFHFIAQHMKEANQFILSDIMMAKKFLKMKIIELIMILCVKLQLLSQ